MTLNEVTKQIYDLSNGSINGEKFSYKQFKDNMNHLFKDLGFTKWFIGVDLPDGCWLCKIYEFKDGIYDYSLPDTREQEQILIDELLGNKKSA